MARTPITVWQIHDDKPGHRNQLRGLTQALADLLPLDVHSIRAPSRRSALPALWSKKFLPGARLPGPDLILGAGHATHFAVLAAKRARGGRSVVLMKPSLPPALFDLCLIPEHDGVSPSPNIVTTRGVLNVICPTQQHELQSGLLLIGGPSAAHGWSNERMLQQLAAIVNSTPKVNWQLTNSRRTPVDFLSQIANYEFTNVNITPHQETEPGWVPKQLARAAQVWVSEDSVSMVYEALTSGASVGVLEVPSKRRGRVAAGSDSLLRDGWATQFGTWRPGSLLTPPPESLDEARRCAELLCQRFFNTAAA